MDAFLGTLFRVAIATILVEVTYFSVLKFI